MANSRIADSIAKSSCVAVFRRFNFFIRVRGFCLVFFAHVAFSRRCSGLSCFTRQFPCMFNAISIPTAPDVQGHEPHNSSQMWDTLVHRNVSNATIPHLQDLMQTSTPIDITRRCSHSP